MPVEAEANRWGRGLQWQPSPSLVHHSPKHCFCGVLDFLCKLSQLWSSLLLFLQAVFSQPTAASSLGPCSKPYFPATSPIPWQETYDSGWNVQGADHMFTSYFVLPSTDCLSHFSISQKSLSIPADFPTMCVSFWLQETLLNLQLSTRIAGPLFYSSFLLPFILTSCEVENLKSGEVFSPRCMGGSKNCIENPQCRKLASHFPHHTMALEKANLITLLWLEWLNFQIKTYKPLGIK